MFQGEAGSLNPEFERMFKTLFGSVMKYLDSQGWGDSGKSACARESKSLLVSTGCKITERFCPTGSWVQVIDEPNWPQPETLQNTLALMKLYKSVDPRVKIYQTRWPEGGGLDDHTAANARGASELRTVPPSAQPLLEQVDWWCPHVCQWTTPGVPEDMAKLRAQRAGTSHPLHITVYQLRTTLM